MDLQHADWWDVCEIMNRESERGEEESAVGLYTDIYLGRLRKTTIILVEISEIWTQDLPKSKTKIVDLEEKSWKSKIRITELP